MNSPSRLKTALLAAASLTAASAVVAGAHSAPMEPVAIEHAVMAADHDSERAPSAITAQKAGLAALATAALAGLAHLVGFGRIWKAAQKTMDAAGAAAAVGLNATVTAAKTVARAAASPFRVMAMLAGLAIIALTGVELFDVEWAGGLLFGALIATTVILGARRARKAFAGSTRSVRR